MKVFKSHGFILNRLSNSASTILENKLKNLYGITLSQWVVISILGEKEGLNASDIQRIVNIRVSSASGILNRMEKNELIMRVKNPNDQREVNLYLSEKAKKIRPEVIRTVKEFNNELLQGFSSQEKKDFKNLIDKAFDNLMLIDKT